jgi:enolase-phosphatase E1
MTRYILTDIEGTTTSIDFVVKTLFPYFRQHVHAFVAQHVAQPSVQTAIADTQQTIWVEENRHISPDEAIEQLIAWSISDRKHTALKALQGEVWREGYLSGALKGHLYADVLPTLRRWQAAGIQMGVYSSGSVAAQKLLFGYSVEGDITPFFSHYFDTHIGHKREVAAYQNIIKALDILPQEILFLSDVAAELDAAQAAGMMTCQLVREKTVASGQHRVARDFGVL